MKRRPPRSTRTGTLVPYTTLCRSAGSRQPRRAILIPETRHHGAARRLDRGDSSSEIAPKLGEISAALGPKAPEEGSGRPEIGASPRLAHRLRCLSHSCRCWSARSKEIGRAHV